MGRGAERKIVQNAFFHWKRHDNKILKVKILLSRNFVVKAPINTLGRTSQLSGIAADFSGGCDGFCDGFVGPEGRILRRILWRIFWPVFPQ